MENHGVLVCSTNSLEDAVDCFEMYEAMAKSIVAAKVLGEPNVISDKDVAILDEVVAARNLKMPGMGKTTLKEVYK